VAPTTVHPVLPVTPESTPVVTPVVVQTETPTSGDPRADAARRSSQRCTLGIVNYDATITFSGAGMQLWCDYMAQDVAFQMEPRAEPPPAPPTCAFFHQSSDQAYDTYVVVQDSGQQLQGEDLCGIITGYMNVTDLPSPIAQTPLYMLVLATSTSLGYGTCYPDSFQPGCTLRVVLCTHTDTADGKGMFAFFWVGDQYIGTDTADQSIAIRFVGQTDTTVTLAYALYTPSDPLCCSTGGTATVRYHWDGTKLTPLDPIPTADPSAAVHR
jgi:hypothetical protein